MKNLIRCGVYSVCLFALTTYSHATASNLLAYYPFDENANDVSGNGYHGDTNGVSLSSSGAVGNCYYFNGNGFVSLPIDQNSLSEFSVSIWVRIENPQPGPYQAHIISTDNNSYGRGIALDLSSQHWDLWLDSTRITTETAYTNGSWQHVAVTYHPGENCMYLNGNLIYADSLSTNPSPYDDSTNIVVGLRNLFFDRGFRGFADELKIYNKVLTSNEVYDLYRDVTSAPPPAYDRGLLAYYPFDHSAEDASSNSFDGIVNGARLSTLGAVSNCYYFSGFEHIDLPINQNSLTQLTYSAWVRLCGSQPGPYQAHILSTDKDSYGRGLALELAPTNWALWVDNGLFDTAITYTPDVWQHVAATYQPGENCMYLNGQLLFRDTSTSNMPPYNDSDNIVVGMRNLFFDRGVHAFIDELKIYNGVLSSNEIFSIYTNCVIPPPPVYNTELIAYYPFDGSAEDVSGNDYHGTVCGATTCTAGVVSNCYYFGGNDYIELPINQNYLENFSCSLWLKVTEAQPGPYNAHVLSTDNNSYGRGVTIYLQDQFTGNDLVWDFWVDNGFFTTEQAVLKDQWQHVVVTYQPGNNRMYLNGDLVHTDSSTSNCPPYNESANIVIGLRNLFLDRGFRGFIDEVKIYNGVLSASEVYEIYTNATSQHPQPRPLIESVNPGNGYITTEKLVLMYIETAKGATVTNLTVNDEAATWQGSNTWHYLASLNPNNAYHEMCIVAYEAETVFTQSVTYIRLPQLRLTAMWDGYWRVRNPSSNSVDFTWEVHKSEECGSGTVEANSDAFFETSTGPKILRLLVDGKIVDVKIWNPQPKIICVGPQSVSGEQPTSMDSRVTKSVTRNEDSPQSPSLSLSWKGVLGQLYTIWSATDLSSSWTKDAEWTDVESYGELMTYDYVTHEGNQRFFKITVSNVSTNL